MERRSRICKSADAFSQWCNVTFLRRVRDTDSDESISGRCWYEAHHQSQHWTWKVAERAIDALFWRDRHDGRGHCELAAYRDYLRAKKEVARFEAARKGEAG